MTTQVPIDPRIDLSAEKWESESWVGHCQPADIAQDRYDLLIQFNRLLYQLKGDLHAAYKQMIMKSDFDEWSLEVLCAKVTGFHEIHIQHSGNRSCCNVTGKGVQFVLLFLSIFDVKNYLQNIFFFIYS